MTMKRHIDFSARIAGALAASIALALVCAAPSAWAAISFDAASRAATSSTGQTSLTWSHTVGSGTDRMLVVSVAVEDSGTADAAVSGVTYNGAALTSVPNSLVNGGGSGIIQTQLFYQVNPATGAHNVVVTFHGPVDGTSSGAVSLFGVVQGAPERVATKVDTSGADSISTSVTTATAGAWVVDVVGSGNS